MVNIKYKLNKVLFVFLVLFLLFITSCMQVGRQEKLAIDVHKGVYSIELNFIENLPPDELYGLTDFQISLLVRNQGAYEARGTLQLLGLGDFASIDKPAVNFFLEGRKSGYPKGDFRIFDFKARIKKIPPDNLLTIKARACYEYETVLNEEICIRKPEAVTGICNVRPLSFSGQGAPIAISYVEPMIIAKGNNNYELKLKIRIENKGMGEVVKKFACSSLRSEDKNIVYVRDVYVGDIPLICNKKEVKLVNNAAEILCSADIGNIKNSYLALLTVELDYSYLTEVSKTVRVREI